MSTNDRTLIRRAVADDPDMTIRDWQRVNYLLGQVAAWEAEPAAMLVLRKRRDARARARRS